MLGQRLVVALFEIASLSIENVLGRHISCSAGKRELLKGFGWPEGVEAITKLIMSYALYKV